MPPVTVHIALGGLIGTVLLAEYFDTRSILIVMGAAGVSDLDVVFEVFMSGAHRTVFHTLILPLGLGIILGWDIYGRENSFIATRWDAYGIRVIWVSIVTLTLAQILLDSFGSGINAFWPLYDRFYMLSGDVSIIYNNGFQVDFVKIIELGTTADTYYGTGFDTKNVGGKRRFPVALTTEQVALQIVCYGAIVHRIVAERRATPASPTFDYLSED